MNQFKRLNNIAGWAVFAFALIVYTLTIERGPSFWDCGEFVAAAYKLQTVHPPGSPLFLMVGRIFSLLAMGKAENVPVMINFMNGMFSALAVLFIFWIFTQVLRRVMLKKEEDYTQQNILAVIIPAAIAGFCATFADSFWFSAVEGEVYALSICFMCFNVWASLKWLEADEAGDKYADRWLVMSAFMQGLSIGVHLLSLLAIPITIIIYYFRKREFNWKWFVGVSLVAMATPLLVMKLIISGVPSIGAVADRIFVNNMGMPIWIGFIVWMVVLLGGLAYAIYYTRKNNHPVWNLVTLLVFSMILGFSCYTMAPIRARANTPIDMNEPKDPFRLVSYLNRDQYGDRPLFYGPQYTATPYYDMEGVDNGSKIWYYNDTNYVEMGYKQKYKWKPGVETFLPRMGCWQEQGKYIDDYRNWIQPSYDIVNGYTDEVVKNFPYEKVDAAQQQLKQMNENAQGGQFRIRDNFGMFDNLNFMRRYQMGFMYMRYLLWNFCGRNSDLQGFLGNDEGRWKTGLGFIDDLLANTFNMAGAQHTSESDRTEAQKNNWANNCFYGIPFLLGIFGMVWLYKKDKKWFFVIFLMFFITGILQIFYLNQPPSEPRERDYAFAGSFLTFAMFIGFGVYGLYEFLKTKMNGMTPLAVAAAVSLLAPFLMGTQGWNDHNRSHRAIAHDMAIDYLNSCPKDAILFTQGDNDTYPLWYAQQVESVRTDVRIVNLSLVGVDWYINYLRRKSDLGKPIKLSIPQYQLQSDLKNSVAFSDDPRFANGYTELKTVMDFVANPQEVKVYQEEKENYFPTHKFKITVDPVKVKAMKMVPEKSYGKILNEMTWELDRNQMGKNDLVFYDILANNFWDRPICFAISCGPDAFTGTQKFAQMDGLVYRLVPIENPSGDYSNAPINTEAFYNFYKNGFLWGNVKDPKCYVDENGSRMLMNPRAALIRLAIDLSNSSTPTISDSTGKILVQGDDSGKKKALEILNKMNTEWPLDRIPLNLFTRQMPEAYYAAGDKVMGDKTRDMLVKLFRENLAYFRKTKTKDQQLSQEAQYDLYLLKIFADTRKRYFPQDTAEYTKMIKVYTDEGEKLGYKKEQLIQQ